MKSGILKMQKGIEADEKAIEKNKIYQEEATEVPAQESEAIKTIPKEPQPEENTPKKEKAGNKANTKPQKGVMGFRAELAKIEVWKLYAEAAGLEIGAMCTAAIDEYMHGHKLTGSQKKIFDLKMRTLAEEKKIKGK